LADVFQLRYVRCMYSKLLCIHYVPSTANAMRCHRLSCLCLDACFPPHSTHPSVNCLSEFPGPWHFTMTPYFEGMQTELSSFFLYFAHNATEGGVLHPVSVPEWFPPHCVQDMWCITATVVLISQVLQCFSSRFEGLAL
jgi:hypothetical protein